MKTKIVTILVSWLFLCQFPYTAVAHQSDDIWEKQRQAMVSLLERSGIKDSTVLLAMNSVPRHEFVPVGIRSLSYDNRALPIELGQTISQPEIVAYMCDALNLKPDETILEIGTGTGYHAAVLSELVKIVYTIEIIPELGRKARDLLKTLGYENINVKIGDGYKGWQEFAPYDAIILTAAPPEIPEPLLQQLKIGGRLIAPVGKSWQELVLVRRTEKGFNSQKLLPVRFVPMTGEAQRKGDSGK